MLFTLSHGQAFVERGFSINKDVGGLFAMVYPVSFQKKNRDISQRSL